MLRRVAKQAIAMNRLRLIILVIGALSVVSSCAVGEAGNDKVKFFYIPFDAETYIPTTVENIEQAANCVFELDKTSPVVTQLVNSVKRAKEGKFENDFVRLKAVNLFENAVIVDRHGGLRFEKLESELRMQYSDVRNTEYGLQEAAKNSGCE